MLKIQLFCQLEPTALTYNTKTINTSASEAITELVKTNYQMKLRQRDQASIDWYKKEFETLLHRTNVTIENIRDIRLNKSEGG